MEISIIMKILVVSYSKIDYDGRLRGLIDVAKILGDTQYITQAFGDVSREKGHYIYKPWRFLTYCGFIYNVISCTRHQYFDMVLADNRKSILPVYLLKILRRTSKIILDLRELYLLKDQRHISGFLGCLFEILFNNKFDVVICANKERASYVAQYYKLKKLPLVYENIRRLSYKTLNEEFIYAQKYKNFFDKTDTTKKRIVITDGLAFSRGLSMIMDAISKLDFVHLYIIGNGSPEDIRKYLKKLKEQSISNISWLGRMEIGELKYFIKNCDIGLVFYPLDTLNNRLCASGKIYEFIFENIPVVVTQNIPLLSIVNTTKIGVATNDFSDGIQQLISKYDYYKKNVKKYSEELSIQQKNECLAYDIIHAI